MPSRPQQLDLLLDQHAKPVRRATEGVDFGVRYDELADDDLRDEIVRVFSGLPERYRVALRMIAAAPAKERLRVVDDIDERAARSA